MFDKLQQTKIREAAVIKAFLTLVVNLFSCLFISFFIYFRLSSFALIGLSYKANQSDFSHQWSLQIWDFQLTNEDCQVLTVQDTILNLLLNCYRPPNVSRSWDINQTFNYWDEIKTDFNLSNIRNQIIDLLTITMAYNRLLHIDKHFSLKEIFVELCETNCFHETLKKYI